MNQVNERKGLADPYFIQLIHHLITLRDTHCQLQATTQLPM